jgi:hypothetical protein
MLFYYANLIFNYSYLYTFFNLLAITTAFSIFLIENILLKRYRCRLLFILNSVYSIDSNFLLLYASYAISNKNT